MKLKWRMDQEKYLNLIERHMIFTWQQLNFNEIFYDTTIKIKGVKINE